MYLITFSATASSKTWAICVGLSVNIWEAHAHLWLKMKQNISINLCKILRGRRGYCHGRGSWWLRLASGLGWATAASWQRPSPWSSGTRSQTLISFIMHYSYDSGRCCNLHPEKRLWSELESRHQDHLCRRRSDWRGRHEGAQGSRLQLPGGQLRTGADYGRPQVSGTDFFLR